MQDNFEYKIQYQLKPTSLKNISDKQINEHWKLYEGYVSQVNILNKEIQQLIEDNQQNTLIYQDRKRRYGFEYNGMILHEYYFENLTVNNTDLLLIKDSELKNLITATWGSFENWLIDFETTGKSRGIGWAILYLDPKNKILINNFINEHQDGHIATFIPLIVMDVWEHAYMIDHGATQRANYIKAFIENMNWKVVEDRYQKTQQKL